MFIETSSRLSQAPEERHMPYVAPPELGKLLCNLFYKHSAPLALQYQGIRQRYPLWRRTPELRRFNVVVFSCRLFS